MKAISAGRQAAAVAVGAVLLGGAQHSVAQDVQPRVQQLEQAVEALDGELQALKRQLEAAKAAPAADSEGVRGRFADGPQISGSDWSVRLQGRAQLDLRTFEPDEWLADSFSLRRARLGAVVSFMKDYSVRVEGEYSGSSVSLTYGYFDINWWRAARIRGGQFKRMFGLERSNSTNFTDFMERSLPDALLEGTYDRGVMVFGTPVEGTTYSLSVTNGTGSADRSSASAQQAQADDFNWTLRLTGDAAQWAGLKDTVLHVGGSHDFGRLGNPTAGTVKGASAQTEARGVTFFTPEAFTGSNVDRARVGVEAAAARGPFKLQGEWLRATYEGTSALGVDYSRDIDAAYLSATWLITGERYAHSYKDGVFGRIKPSNAFRSGGGWGAFEAGIRYSQFDGSDFSSANAPGTGLPSATAPNSAKADAWTLGLKWIPLANARFMLNYVQTSFDTPLLIHGTREDRERAINLRAQLDF